jgi:hypothetical protein
MLLIKFKSFTESFEIEYIKVLFESMPQKIKGVISVEWGVNDSPEHINKGYTHSVLMTFVNEEARQVYLPHPEHEALKKVFSPLLEDIIVFDYQI